MNSLSTKTDIQIRAVYSSLIPTNSFGKRQQVLQIKHKKCKDKDELYFSYNHGHKSWVSGAFSNSNRSNPSLTLQTNVGRVYPEFFFRVQSTLYRVEEGELQENSEKVALF